jgi:hypothetical protein
MSGRRKLLGLVLIAITLCLLYPGVTEPVLTLSGTIEKSRIAELGIDLMAGDSVDDQTRQTLVMVSSFLGFDRIEGQLLAYQNTRSIWGTATELASKGNLLVAVLIILFSVIIPSLKLALQAGSLLVHQARARRLVLRLNAVLSKWSMTDVFVMALLVAYMAGGPSGKMGGLLTMHSHLEVGFYYFLAYCLFSIAASSVLQDPSARKLDPAPATPTQAQN